MRTSPTLYPAPCVKNSHHVAPFDPRLYRNVPAPHRHIMRQLQRPQQRQPLAHVFMLPWSPPHATLRTLFLTLIHRIMKLPIALISDTINRRMSTYRSLWTMPIARRRRRLNSIWAPLSLWAHSAASFSWLQSSRQSSFW